MSKIKRRLANQFVVDRYQLRESNNNGGVKIIITGRKIGPPSKRLVFNQRGLKVDDAKVTHFSKSGSEELVPYRINYHQSFEQVRLHFERPIYSGRYEIVMKFHYKNRMLTKNPQLREIFPSIDENNTLKEFEVS